MKAFTQLKIKDLILKNRFVVAPLCSFSANPKGEVNQVHLSRYNAWAMGGFGLIVVEASAVDPCGRLTQSDLGIWNDSQVNGLSEVTQSIHSWKTNTKVAIQLGHSGRKGSLDLPWNGFGHIPVSKGGFPLFSCSPIPFDKTFSVPKELTVEEIKELEEKFVAAAKRAVKAGFDAIEINGGMGFLINQFLSPLTNKRTDDYGGTFENRTRFLIEIVDKVRQEIPPEMPLLVRLSISEYAKDKNGWDVQDSVKLCNILKTKGVDLIDCTGGNNTSDCIAKSGPCFQVDYAEAIRKQCGIMTSAVGEITELEHVKEVLDKADLVMIGRAAFRNPYFPLLCAEKLGFTSEQLASMYPTLHGAFLTNFWNKDN